MNYEIVFHKDARKEIIKLDNSVQLQVAKQINKLEINPYSGKNLGNKNGIDLTGLKSIYADNKKIRIVYQVIEDKVVVFIVAIGKRDDFEVYKTAFERISNN